MSDTNEYSPGRLMAIYHGPHRDEYRFFCPACNTHHPFVVGPGNEGWTFNGNLERPTFTPSLRVLHWEDANQTTCHLNITDGQIYYHGDSPHSMAGQTVPMGPLPEKWMRVPPRYVGDLELESRNP